jgi:hypothetical protein
MSEAAFLSNWYRDRKGHGYGPKPGNPAHPWHWLRKSEDGWESIRVVADGPQHFETAEQAINHATAHGWVVDYDRPKFEHTTAMRGHLESPRTKRRAA